MLLLCFRHTCPTDVNFDITTRIYICLEITSCLFKHPSKGSLNFLKIFSSTFCFAPLLPFRSYIVVYSNHPPGSNVDFTDLIRGVFAGLRVMVYVYSQGRKAGKYLSFCDPCWYVVYTGSGLGMLRCCRCALLNMEYK